MAFETGKQTHFNSDGKAVQVALQYTVEAEQIAYVEGWLGRTNESGDSGDYIALNVGMAEYQFTVPSLLSVSKGDIVYVDITDLTGHIPDESAYSTTADGSKVALFKATSDKDANNVVTGVLLAGLFVS